MNLRAEKISRQYFRQGKGTNVFTAVQETDFEIKAGEFLEITGRSGSGKSTFLDMLAGLLSPTTGRILWEDQDIYALSDEECSRLRNTKAGIIPQGQTALKALTVRENVLLPALMYGKADAAVRERAAELMKRVEIDHLADVYPDELSGGERRRLSVVRALVHSPQIVFADEPTADLDDESTHIVLGLLRESADAGTAVVLVTHEREAASYADRHYRMNGGVLTEETAENG